MDREADWRRSRGGLGNWIPIRLTSPPIRRIRCGGLVDGEADWWTVSRKRLQNAAKTVEAEGLNPGQGYFKKKPGAATLGRFTPFLVFVDTIS